MIERIILYIIIILIIDLGLDYLKNTLTIQKIKNAPAISKEVYQNNLNITE